jgi:SAM-dependent methyltransferase
MTLWKSRSARETLEIAQPDRSQLDLRSVIRNCPACGCADSYRVCSAHDLAAQQRFLQQFYRRRWRVQNGVTGVNNPACTQQYVTDIVSCKACRLLYRNPRPPQASIVSAYAQKRYDRAYLRTEYRIHRAWAARKISSVAQRLPHLSRNKAPRVLEIDCFLGGFLAEGLALGWDMFGVDPSEEVTAFCREQRLPIFHGTVDDADLNPASFDAVVMWNTFGQLSNPHSTLAVATRLLKNGGLLVLRVPNGNYFHSMMTALPRLPKGLHRLVHVTLAWNDLLTFPYLYGYGIETLTGLTASYGFKRTACIPDTLPAAPADQLKRWAAVEGRFCNAMCRAVWHAAGPSGRLRVAPWLDLYCERACTDIERDRTSLGLGLLPVCPSPSLTHT